MYTSVALAGIAEVLMNTHRMKLELYGKGRITQAVPPVLRGLIVQDAEKKLL